MSERLFWECPVCDRKEPYDSNRDRVYVYGCNYGDGVDGCDICGHRQRCSQCDEDIVVLGIICTQSEWDEQEERWAREREERAEKYQERQERYEKALKNLSNTFKVSCYSGNTYVGQVHSENLYLNNKRILMKEVEKIDRTQACKCRPGCEVVRGRGYILNRNKEKLEVVPVREWVRGWWPFCEHKTSSNLLGTVTLLLQNSNSTIKIDVECIYRLERYTPSIDEVLGKE